MFTEFASVQLRREELKELHAALVLKALVEDRLRREKGLEPVAERPLLEQVENLLSERDEAYDAFDRASEDHLWEYAWYVFTDEWAWFRAERETAEELGVKKNAIDKVEFEKMVEIRYHKEFDRYVAEVDMVEEGKAKTMRAKQPKAS